MEDNNVNIEYEMSPTSQKGKVVLPNQGTNELMLATARLVNTISSGFESVGKMLKNSTNVIGKPIAALIEGKTNEIELANQFITARLMYVKETNATMHMAYVAEELNKKVEKGENIPDKIEESDKLYLIQDNASTTSNDEFLKLWAKLYAEEACKPNTVSRKTIKLFESMEPKIIRILENEIFPYCDEKGFYWGKIHDISSLLLAQDYGFIDEKQISTYTSNYKETCDVKLNNANILHIHPGFSYSPQSNYVLTSSGLEIKNILKIYPNRVQIKDVINKIEESAIYWNIVKNLNIKLKQTNIKIQKFIICDKQGKIKYPKNFRCKTLNEYKKNALKNIEVLQNAK